MTRILVTELTACPSVPVPDTVAVTYRDSPKSSLRTQKRQKGSLSIDICGAGSLHDGSMAELKESVVFKCIDMYRTTVRSQRGMNFVIAGLNGQD